MVRLVPRGDRGDKRSMLHRLTSPLRWAVDYVLPPRCAGCGTPVGEDHRFCATCWGKLRFIAPPWCAACHVPFAFDRGEGAVCASCAAAPPRHAGVRAAVAYGDVAGSLAVRLKHGGRIAIAGTMARAMVRLVPEGADLLIPVPLHRARLWRRGFNQAALIAAALSRRCGVAHDPLVLERLRATRLLRGLGRRARARMVAGAFRVRPSRRAAIKGRSVILVDDVYTTGATALACTRALLAAGAGSVTILCWARVLAGADAND
ncbi:amidophosphoribosyltransferase [Sphingomonas metalli]|uniref:Amidophosphoribosyltransferase n=2 Tax=Sphingomonas metalli TaxID=1779358 RepID=A0A916WNV2_9SPHN|nr:amidophosphoribosyltransferase [Sphingomonas metalli]